jgi:NDP-sugar pyrophosphorylase family protein
VFALRRAALDLVNRLGFMDLKEQWLTKMLAAGGKAFAHPLRGRGAMPLRTRRNLLDAARVGAGLDVSERVAEPVSRRRTERGVSGATVLCAGARVAASAVVHDAVVMPGAEVGEDAVVVRTIVAPGVRVENGSELIDVVAGPSGPRSDEWSQSLKRLRANR